MRIGFYHERAGSRNVGGIAMFVQKIADALSPSHEVYLYTGAGELTSTVRQSGVEVVRIPEARWQRDVSNAVSSVTPLGGQPVDKLFAYAESRRAGVLDHMDRHLDLVFTHQYLDDLLLSRSVDVPVVYEYHGLRSTGLGAKARERFSAAEWTVANSRDTASRVRETFGREVDEIVRPGVDAELFSPDAEPAFADDRPTVLFVGRVVGDKGLHDLFDAVAATDVDPNVYVVGTGDVEQFRAYAGRAGIGDAVRFVGEVPHDELAGYYGACDVFCNPSHYESFGMVNLEAMACGAPVVTTDVGGIPEYATHGDTALLVPPEDPGALRAALEELLDSPGLRDRLGERARRRAREFTWRAQAERFEQFCERHVVTRTTA